MKKLLSFLLVAIMACSVVPAMAESTAGADTIVIGITSEPAYLEPNAPAIGGTEIHVIDQMFEGLVTMNEDNSAIVPCLASDWTISDDGLTYTFNLVPGVTFSDGTPVKGEDWVWSLLRARDTETSEYSFIAEAIDKVEATDSQVVITLKSPTSAFLAQLCSFNMVLGCKAYAEKMTEDEYIMNPMGTGPYMLKEWNRGNYVWLVANPNYRDAASVKTPNIKFQVVSDDNTRLMQLQAGQIDIMGDVPASQMSVVKSTDGLNLSVYPSTQIRYLLLNTSKEPFNDPAVRKALAYGINKAEMAEVVYGEYGAAVASVLSEAHGKFYNTDLQVIPYQPEEAKKMLADAGYPDGITFTMSIPNGNEVYEEISVLLQASLAQAGFTMNIEHVESKILYQNAQSNALQCVCYQWSDDYYDPSEVIGWITDYDQSSAWFTFLEDKDLDAEQAAAIIEQDADKRVKMYWDLQQKIYDNYNVIPLFRNSFAYACSSKVQGLNVSTFNDYYCKYLTKSN